MSDASTRPFLAIYVAWHPGCAAGEAIPGALHDHYRRNLFTNVAGGRLRSLASFALRSSSGHGRRADGQHQDGYLRVPASKNAFGFKSACE